MKNITTLIFIFIVLHNALANNALANDILVNDNSLTNTYENYQKDTRNDDYNITATIPSGTVVYVVNVNEIIGLLFSIVILLLICIGFGIWYCVMKRRRNALNSNRLLSTFHDNNL